MTKIDKNSDKSKKNGKNFSRKNRGRPVGSKNKVIRKDKPPTKDKSKIEDSLINKTDDIKVVSTSLYDGLQAYNSFRKFISGYYKLKGVKKSNKELNDLWRDRKSEIKEYVEKYKVPIYDLSDFVFEDIISEKVRYIKPDLEEFKSKLGLFVWFNIESFLVDDSYGLLNLQDEITLDFTDFEGLGKYVTTKEKLSEDWDTIYDEIDKTVRGNNKSPLSRFVLNSEYVEFDEVNRINRYYYSCYKVSDVLVPIEPEKQEILADTEPVKIEKEKTKQMKLGIIEKELDFLRKDYERGEMKRPEYLKERDQLLLQLKEI
jgi:hypothetical protein